MGPFKRGTGTHREGDEEGLGSGPPPPRSVQISATLTLMFVTLGSLVAIAYASIVKGDASATTLLGTLATAALAALVVLSGGGHSGE